MTLSRAAIIVSFVVLLGVPMLFRAENPAAPGGAKTVIILTPHNEQIRYEFARAFDQWHLRHYGERANVIFNVPGGTTEIRKMLEAQFASAIENHQQPGGDADLVFGGGTYEHDGLKRGVRIVEQGVERYEPITQAVDFSDQWLRETYGENAIGDRRVYDPEKHWFGNALSSFGIVFNRELLADLHATEPSAWADLARPELRGWVALVNPGQSGSVLTTFDAILKRSGWERGWQILRRAGANARYFSGSSLKPPIDVSQGSAAVGICIDFFGRYQSQALSEAGEPNRIGYIDPPQGSTIDVDPISMLRNPPNPQTAKRFIEFCLSDEGQALWQFPRRSSDSRTGQQLGPERFELRRMPAVRSMYERYGDRFIDQVNPFALATPFEFPDEHFRDFIVPLFAAMVMDNHSELKAAWNAIVTHPAYSTQAQLVRSQDVSDPKLRQMLDLFDAMPDIAGPEGAKFSFAEPSTLGTIRKGWLRGQWNQARLWNPETTPADEMRRQFGDFFRSNYRKIVELAEQADSP
jgi:iron(III) transport system substrate-binding protein